MINLNNCKPGQKLRARNGEILTYKLQQLSSFYPHIVEYKNGGTGSRTNDGLTHSEFFDHDYDIVEIIEENNMNTEITELENELKLAEEKAANIKIALEAKRKAEKEIKVGDYVVCIDNHGFASTLNLETVYKVISISRNGDLSFGKGYGYHPKRFRKATREEITKHLLDEAAQKGFVVGVKYQYGKFSTQGKIKSLGVIFGSEDINSGNNSSVVVDKKGFPFVIIYGNPHGVYPIDIVTIIKDEISIEVNGVKYIAKFLEQNQVVNFGCANIAFSIFESAYKFMTTPIDNPANNRKVETVKIGAGEFNLELITKIYNKILELSIKSQP
jgi:hypothetical protein